jgi:hypothetical protein
LQANETGNQGQCGSTNETSKAAPQNHGNSGFSALFKRAGLQYSLILHGNAA